MKYLKNNCHSEGEARRISCVQKPTLQEGVSFRGVPRHPTGLRFLSGDSSLRCAPFRMTVVLLCIGVFLLIPPLVGVRGGFSFAQKVGVVLSGGASAGLAHIGVLKALEENDIPIDYIAGTSMGAMVAGMYAIGWSPEKMEALAGSDKFRDMAKGQIEDIYKYYFKQKEVNGSWITMKFAMDTIWQTSLPTNIISPIAIDFEMMAKLSGASAAANYDFDNLFIPFRCVAADIESKKQVIFKEGHLNEAIRASMSYPFYLKPITVDGKLLFDGGLYNNFPADVMYNDFYPDIIIGSNVSRNLKPPDEDNVISQIKSMLMSKTDYSVICDNGILIEPKSNFGQFSFSDTKSIIDSGYNATIAIIEEIKTAVYRRVDKQTLTEKRERFKKKQPPLIFDNIYIDGLNKYQANYVQSLLRRKNKYVSIDDIKPAYFRVFGDDKIKSIYPIAEYNGILGLYDLYLKVKKEKEIIFDFGGNFSSKPINQAYIGLQYNYLGNTALSLFANTYFGKLYGSAQLKGRLDFPVKLPFYLETEFTINRWDYFRSRATFFEDVKPSYLVQNEKFGGLSIGIPVKNKGRIKTGVAWANLTDDYYQTKEFSKSDTTDRTKFNVITPYLLYERSTLNRKQYANEGSYLAISGRHINGRETSIPGSTSISNETISRSHQWLQFKMVYDTYYKRKGKLRLGFFAEAVYSTQKLFNNYTASILRAPAFQPTPESKTLFLETFRAHMFLAIGHKIILNLKKNIDFRLEGYIFQPYREILKIDDSSLLNVKHSKEVFGKRFTIATAAAVYHTPIGPFSLSLNYYYNVPEVAPEDKIPLTFLFHFGYIIFNRGALD